MARVGWDLSCGRLRETAPQRPEDRIASEDNSFASRALLVSRLEESRWQRKSSSARTSSQGVKPALRVCHRRLPMLTALCIVCALQPSLCPLFALQPPTSPPLLHLPPSHPLSLEPWQPPHRPWQPLELSTPPPLLHRRRSTAMRSRASSPAPLSRICTRC